MQRTIVHTTRLAADADAVWRWVTTPAGINDELRPWLRMTIPRGWHGTGIADVRAGAHLGKSWLLFLRVLPFDYDDLTIAEIGPDRFLERSRLLSARVWEHERSVRADGDGCEVRDRVTFEPRAPVRWIPGGGRMHAGVLNTIFRHRHRRLVGSFGAG